MDESHLRTADEMHLPLERSMFELGLEMAKAQLRDQGIDVETHPIYKDIFGDEATVNRIIDQAMDLANAQRDRAIVVDKGQGYK